MCLLYVKKFFQPHQWRLFFFRPQNARILLFLVKLVWERKGHSDRSKHFQNFFCMGSFKYASNLRKKNISNATVKFFSLKSWKYNLQFFLVWRYEGDQESQFENETFSIVLFVLKVLNLYLPYVKDIFNCICDVFLYLNPKTLRFLNFCWS